MKLGKTIPSICHLYFPSVYTHYNIALDQFKQAHMKQYLHHNYKTWYLGSRLCLMFKWPPKYLLPAFVRCMFLQQLMNCMQLSAQSSFCRIHNRWLAYQQKILLIHFIIEISQKWFSCTTGSGCKLYTWPFSWYTTIF